MDQTPPSGSSALKIFFTIVVLAALFVAAAFWWVSSRSAASRDAAAEASRAGRPIAEGLAPADLPEDGEPRAAADGPELFPKIAEIDPLDLTVEEVRAAAVVGMTRWPYDPLPLVDGAYQEEITTCDSCGYRDFYALAIDTSAGGFAFGDIDGDGDRDAAVASYEADVTLLASAAGVHGPKIDPKNESQNAVLVVFLNEGGLPIFSGAVVMGSRYRIEDMRVEGQEVRFSLREMLPRADGKLWPGDVTYPYGYRLGLGGRLEATASPFPARVATGTVAVKGDGFSFQIPNSFTAYPISAALADPSPDGTVNLGLSWGSESYPSSGWTEFYAFANYGYAAGDSNLLIRQRLPGAIRVVVGGEGEQGVIQPAAPNVAVTDLAWDGGSAQGKITISNPAPRPAFTRNLVVSVSTADPGAIAEAARVLLGIADSIEFDESVWW